MSAVESVELIPVGVSSCAVHSSVFCDWSSSRWRRSSIRTSSSRRLSRRIPSGRCWRYDTPDARFQAEVVARGLSVPVSLAFLPDGRALVAERPVGRLSIVDLGTGTLTPIDGVPAVVGQVDGGLMDVVVHPGFARDSLLFYVYSERTDSGNATVIERARLRDNRIVERQRLLSVHPYIDNVNQFGARLVLDHGFLYAGIGDREMPERAQDLSTDLGKIIRLREDGTIPPDNPFVGKGGARAEIWSLGHRNIHGLAIEPRTGLLWEHEHGPRGGDEINLIRAGRNYGWPVITYGIEYSGEPVGAGITHHDGMEQPRYFYIPSIAPTGMAFYTGADFAQWRGNIFLGSLSYRHLNRVVLERGRVVREERLLRDRGWRIREVRQGLDGFLYLGVESGLIVRIRPFTGARCERGITTSDPWMRVPADLPLSIASATAAYDAEAHRIILLGTRGDTTWEWDGHAWTPSESAGPGARGASMATNPGGGVLLFGGRDASGAPIAGAWRYVARRWTRLPDSDPPGRAGAAMAFDLDHHRVLIRGGAPCTDRRMWSWSDSAWTVVDSAGPAPLESTSMSYDLSTRSLVLAGGRTCDGRPSRESWRWDGRRWFELSVLPAFAHPCLVYSPARNRMLLFTTDSSSPRAWELHGAHWARTAPAPPILANAACAADPGNQRVVLVGSATPESSARTYLLLH